MNGVVLVILVERVGGVVPWLRMAVNDFTLLKRLLKASGFPRFLQDERTYLSKLSITKETKRG